MTTQLNNREKINKSKIRIGRGIGSGKGKTSGRGVGLMVLWMVKEHLLGLMENKKQVFGRTVSYKNNV